MSSCLEAIHVLQTLQRPTTNPRTDQFGAFRRWGYSRGWRPQAGYSPIHGGVDFSAGPDPIIRTPANGHVWGMMRPFPVGSCIIQRPQWMGAILDNVMLVYMHCEPTEEEWVYASIGSPLTRHAGHGVGLPHLHFEVNVTEPVWEALVRMGTVDDTPVTDDDIRRRAAMHDLEPEAALERCHEQMRRWGISELLRDGIKTTSLPMYRRSRHSRVGTEITWRVNPWRLL